MAWRTLDEGTARSIGFVHSEDAIRYVCRGCKVANLDFEGDEFCPIQTVYGFDGEHKAIQYDSETHSVRCEKYAACEPTTFAEGQMEMVL